MNLPHVSPTNNGDIRDNFAYLIDQVGGSGMTGPQGDPGRDGAAGSDGAPGPSGTTGATGTTGAQGAIGDTGAAGSDGNQGIQGAQGVAGGTGTTGAKGDTGTQGVQGVAGDVGPQGPAGTITRATGGVVYAALSNGVTAMALATNSVAKVTPTTTASFTTTVPAAGCVSKLIILTSGTTTYTITFGTGFKPTATLATGTTSARVFVIEFVSDGTYNYEVGRTAAMVA